jgi:uncharacterized coiled-coil DUF342 family protein
MYSKNLIEVNDESAELRQKFKVASHNIAQLKDEIDGKDQTLTTTAHALNSVKKELSNLTS